jgi:tRNA nucleotidyltransferase (CCA-adding enzyme)
MKVLEKVKKEVFLEVEKQKEIEEKLFYFKKLLKKEKVDFFIGGSVAKNTVIKKDKYDIDVFIRFKTEEEIIKKFDKIIKKISKKAEKIHGSRDYYNIPYGDIIFEIVPTIKLTKPENAKNSTDLSYFHVSYVTNKIKKNKKLANEIKLAKIFTFANNCYGAESYISGFSGYALELLIIYYKTFEKFIREMAKSKGKIIIDLEKYYKKKEAILNEINESKLFSPIIIVDPTFKQRNVTSALSQETFDKFKESCKKFLKSQSEDFFSKEKMQNKRLNEINRKKPLKIILTTDKQEGAIAGSKLLKFYNFLDGKISKYYKILDKEFVYNDRNSAECYFVLKKKEKILIKGPPTDKTINVIAFKEEHKKTYVKKKIIYAEEKNNKNIKNIIDDNKKIMKEMSITKIEIK